MNKKALIFYITDQDGSYLTKLLLEKSRQVFEVLRYKSKKIIFISDFIEITLKKKTEFLAIICIMHYIVEFKLIKTISS